MRNCNVCKAVALSILLGCGTTGMATYSITVNNPADDTHYASNAPMSPGGVFYWNISDTQPAALRIRSYEADGTTIGSETNASTFNLESPYNWSGTTQAAYGKPGVIDDSPFHVKYRLMDATSVEIGTDKVGDYYVKNPTGS